MTIDKLTSRHSAMMRSLVIDGLTPNQVAELFSITPSRLSILRSSPLWQSQEAKLREEIKSSHLQKQVDRIANLTEKAVDALEDCVQPGEDSRVRLASAKEILDRVGVGTPKLDKTFSPVIQLYIPPHWNNKEGVAINITPDED